MPPGDTIYIPGQTGPPPPVGDPYADSLVHSLWQEQPYVQEEKKPQFLFPQWALFLFVLLLALASAYFYIIRPASAKKRKIRRLFTDDSPDNILRDIRYDQLLSKFNPYYHSLPGDLKKRFLRRTLAFKESKEFRFHSMLPEEHITVLISGAAVQLTFGLRHYLIEYFSVINVIQREYSYAGNDNIVEGHVHATNRTINISWNSFILDYEDYSDSQNVGLHELSHAISFDFLYGFQENKHPHYEEGLKEYIQEAGPIFKELREGKCRTLDDYAAINVEEFWAVSIETFFENPEEFSTKMPGLYDAICDLLNQDPLRQDKIINKGLAGLANL